MNPQRRKQTDQINLRNGVPANLVIIFLKGIVHMGRHVLFLMILLSSVGRKQMGLRQWISTLSMLTNRQIHKHLKKYNRHRLAKLLLPFHHQNWAGLLSSKSSSASSNPSKLVEQS